MTFHADRPFNSLPLLPPKQELETKKSLKLCIRARVALAELNRSGNLIPNVAMLINTLPLLEAQASSEIENIVTTTDRLFEYSGRGEQHADPASKEALRYRTALKSGFEFIHQRPISTRLAEQLCSTVKGTDMRVRSVPGTALASSRTGAVIYTPPEGEALLRDLLGNWEDFLHAENDIDALIKMAVLHYQFEAIHPFTDGNGRTGRVLNILYLIEQGLLDLPVLYLSRYFIAERESYYGLLQNVTAARQWQDWIEYVLNGVEQTAVWTRQKIEAISALLRHTTEYVCNARPDLYSRELLEILFTQPYCRIADLVNGGIAKRQTASVYLKQLVEIGVLEERKVGREKLFLHPKLIQTITGSNEFAAYP